MTDDGTVPGQRQDRHALVVIDQVKPAQQGVICCLAMREVALVEAFAIHPREESRDSPAILRSRLAQRWRQRTFCPRLAGAHVLSPATKSAIA